MGVEPHPLPLAEPERPRLLPDRVRHADAAEVVRERGAPHERDRVRREAHAPRRGLGELRHARRVLAKPRRLEIGERGDGHEGGVDPFARDPDLRKRLDLQRLLPHPRLVQLGEHLVEVARGEIGESRLVRRARSTLDDCACLLGAGGGEKDGDVSRHVQETHRQRDRVAAGDTREPQPVPALEDVFERRLGARAEAEPPGEPLRHLAVHRQRLAGRRKAVGDGLLDHGGAELRGATEADVRPEEREDLRGVARVDERERGPRHDVVAVQLRRLVPVRGAPGGVKERDVVRVDELLRGCSGELAETDREHGGAQRVLERLPGAEVGREREGADHLGSADGPLAGRQPCRACRGILRRHVGMLPPFDGAERSTIPRARRSSGAGLKPARRTHVRHFAGNRATVEA